MIRTFRDRDTRAVFQGEFVKRLVRRVQQRACEKLKYLDSAGDLRSDDPAVIRINKQWRVCFKWKEGDAFDVEIVDYH